MGRQQTNSREATMRQIMNLQFETNHASVYNQQDLNSNFAEGSLRVMYTGANRNHSFIDRESVEAALPSLYNVPIVANYIVEDNMIGGHDVGVTKDENGKPRLKHLAVPCGVVPEHAKFSFQDLMDENGNCHEYLVVDGVLLWKREDVFEHIEKDLGGAVDHSMEIGVLSGFFDGESGLYRIKQFEFQALCLLERDEPCFEGSMLELFSVSDFKTKMAQMMQDLKSTYTLASSESEDDQNHSKEGGETLEEIETMQEQEINEQEAVAEETEQEFSVEEQTETPAEEPAEEKFAAEDRAEEEPVETPEEEPERKDYALNSDIWDALAAAFAGEKIEMPWGLDRRYWLIDFDYDKMEVYAQDGSDWLLYGFSFSMNGDRADIDLQSKHRVKYAIVPYDNGNDNTAAIFTNIAEKFSALNEQLEELRTFKNNVEAERDAAAREEVFGKFEDLNGVEAFEALRLDNKAFDVQTLEEKCYAIRGKQNVPAKFSVGIETPKLVVEHTDGNEPYGGLFIKYQRR